MRGSWTNYVDKDILLLGLLGLLIRIRSDPVFLPGSGSGFKISLDLEPVSAPGSRSKKSAEENLKIMTKDRQKIKKASIFLLKIV